MAILGVDDFKSKLKGGGARANLFKATLNFPPNTNPPSGIVELASFMCKAAVLPASTVASIPVPFRGREVKVAGDRTFEPWNVTIINDTDFAVRNAMEAWMNTINQHKNNTGLTNPQSYQADLLVDQLDKDGAVLKRYTFRGCFPTSVEAIQVSYDQTNIIEEFGVTFEVQYWESNTTT